MKYRPTVAVVGLSDGRSPYGERGLKFVVAFGCEAQAGRSPYGERGLKYEVRRVGHVLVGRSPYGERGLKSQRRVQPDRAGRVALLTESVD